MENRKPLNFAQALRSKPPVIATEDESPPAVESGKPQSQQAMQPEGHTAIKQASNKAPKPASGQATKPKLASQPAPVESQDDWQATQPEEERRDYSRYPSRRQRKTVTIRLPVHKLEQYKMWCFFNKVDLQLAVERGLDIVTGKPQSQQAPIDMIDFDEGSDNDGTSSILSFYSKWTGNKPTQPDREVALTLLSLPLVAVQQGVLLSVLRAKKRINSLKYCLGAIEESAEAGSGENYVKYLIEALGKGDG